jgi:hypothetical protein
MKYTSFVKYLTLLIALIAVTGSAGAQTFVLDHFWCYPFTTNPGFSGQARFFDPLTGVSSLTLGVQANESCNPVQKTVNGVVTPIADPAQDFVLYSIAVPVQLPQAQITINNQFGNQSYTVIGGTIILVPAGEGPIPPPPPPSVSLDHYQCYGPTSAPPMNILATLQDNFTTGTVTVQSLAYFCNPVVKTHGGTQTVIQHPQTHLACYWTSPVDFSGRSVNTQDQFSTLALSVGTPNLLCVPSTVQTWTNGGSM